MKTTSRYFTFILPIIKSRLVRNYAPATFTIMIMVVFILLAIKPTLETIFVLQKKVVDAKEILQKLDQKTNDLNLARQNYNNLEASAKFKIEQTLPDNATVRTIAHSLEESAQKNEASVSALQLQSFTLEAKKQFSVEDLAEIEFTFNTEGSYPKLLSTLEALKSTNRLITINSVSFHSSEGEGQGLIMSISGKAYFIK